MAIDVRTKRIYEAAVASDGYRVLTDHTWPRGVSRDRARLDEWRKELAPSDALRRWFDHLPDRFPEFRSRYRDELGSHQESVEQLRRRARHQQVTIVYAARDRDHNNAIVLAELLNNG